MSTFEGLTAVASLLLPAIEAEIFRRMEKVAGADTALHSRCILASHIMAACLKRAGQPAEVEYGSTHIEASGSAALDVDIHAWVRCGRHMLLDPTAIQLQRDRWPLPICNIADRGLLLATHVDLRRAPEKWGMPGITIAYVPWKKNDPKRRRAMASPDAQQPRWFPMAQAILGLARPAA